MRRVAGALPRGGRVPYRGVGVAAGRSQVHPPSPGARPWSPILARILALTPDLARNPTYTAYQLAGALSELGHACTVAGTTTGSIWSPLSEELAGAESLGPPRFGLGRDRRFLELVEAHDLVYAFKAMPTSLGAALAACRRVDRPVALHLDDWDGGYFSEVGALRRAWYGVRGLADPSGDLWLRATEWRVGRADVLTVSSSRLQRRFGGTVMVQGVDTERVDPARHPRTEARRRLGVEPDADVILFLGTPRLHKGLAGLVSDPELQSAIWIVGGAEDELRESLPEGAMRSVTLRPRVSFTEAAWYMAACDVFVVPQRAGEYAAHQVPAKLVHAMAMGCAVVATDVGDIGDVLGRDGAAGVLVAPGDDAALTRAARGLLSDPARRAGLGAAARSRAVREYGWSAMARALDPLVAPLL